VKGVRDMKLFKAKVAYNFDHTKVIGQKILDNGGEIMGMGVTTEVYGGKTGCWLIFYTVEDEVAEDIISQAIERG
jgi:hypothetical protein